MRYKLYHEPHFAFEAATMLVNIVNGKSIKDEMEESIARYGSHNRQIIESYYAPSIELEDYMKQNTRFDIPGYKKTGKTMAEFLFTSVDNIAFSAPISSIILYDLALKSGVDNKYLTIGICLGESIDDLKDENDEWQISDALFFKHLDASSDIPDNYKLTILKLMFGFEEYYEYAQALFRHTEELLRQQLPKYVSDIAAHIKFIEGQLNTPKSELFSGKLGVAINDNQLYHIYPRMYDITSMTLIGTGYCDPVVFMGHHLVSVKSLAQTRESDNVKSATLLKCLADDTKQAILQLLKDGPLYGSQLAEKLNCTSANVSHHTNALIKLGVVHVQKGNNRVYFHLNKEAISKLLDNAKGLFM